MKIKDFTVGQVVYAFSYEDIALLKGLKPKSIPLRKLGGNTCMQLEGKK